jgi:hypothetical protein
LDSDRSSSKNINHFEKRSLRLPLREFFNILKGVVKFSWAMEKTEVTSNPSHFRRQDELLFNS